MTRKRGNLISDDYLRQGAPTNVTFAETIPRYSAGADLAIAATGVELSVGVPLNSGDLVTTITFVTGATAAGTPTAGYLCLRDPAGALLAQSADLGNTARTANTAYGIALATAQLISTPGLYYVGISFTAGTVPTLRGATVLNGIIAGAVVTGAKVLSRSHGSAVGAVAPATTATPTTTFAIPYLVCT